MVKSSRHLSRNWDMKFVDYESAEIYITARRLDSPSFYRLAFRSEPTIVTTNKSISILSPFRSINVFLGLFQCNVHVAVNRLQLSC